MIGFERLSFGHHVALGDEVWDWNLDDAAGDFTDEFAAIGRPAPAGEPTR